jgi:hypothetical protein
MRFGLVVRGDIMRVGAQAVTRFRFDGEQLPGINGRETVLVCTDSGSKSFCI